MPAIDIKKALARYASKTRAQHSQRFFKTGPGEYGEGDVFIGVRVPDQRKVARAFRGESLPAILSLLKSKVHEHRLTALIMLVDMYRRSDDQVRAKIARAYLAHTAYINNWDLVDSSAPYILGDYYFTRPRAKLVEFVASKDLWKRRIAVLATAYFIQRGDFSLTLKFAQMLLRDKEDLMHKAVGWMLREVGKKDQATLEAFLQKHKNKMPRTMLRYAIERLPEKKRKFYLL